jgi:nucleotide-binding universal stress UspA family protein
MSTDTAYKIVVGVDGSPASKAALGWALWHAGLTGGEITALMAWDYPPIYNWEIPGPEDFNHRTATALREVISEVAEENPNTEIHKEVAQGNPAKALIDSASDADLLVVGSRGHGGFTGALLGSVSQHCVHHAPCPIVVHGSPAPNRTRRPTGSSHLRREAARLPRNPHLRAPHAPGRVTPGTSCALGLIPDLPR